MRPSAPPMAPLVPLPTATTPDAIEATLMYVCKTIEN